jgi:hypothetical protein
LVINKNLVLNVRFILSFTSFACKTLVTKLCLVTLEKTSSLNPQV